MIPGNEVVFTQISAKDLADLISIRVREEVKSLMPDEFISATEASKILGIKNYQTILRYIDKGELTNYGTGEQRPRVSRRECTELRKRIVNGRLQKK